MNHLIISLTCLVCPAQTGDLQVRTETNVAVPMRDGVVLRADVHRPDRGGPYPVLVMRTPYSKKGRRFGRFVKAGYIVVCQDARGRYESGGQWESFVRPETRDAQDGYDTVEWAAKLPGCNGKVGTFGASYNAFLQWRTAPLRPPSLVAMAAFSIPARYTDLEGPGTIRPGRRLNWWISGMTPDTRAKNGRPGTTTRAEGRQHWKSNADRWLRFLPYSKLPQEVFEEEAPFVQQWLTHPHTDPWKLHKDVNKITVPNLNVVGWWDHCNGHLLLDQTIRTQAADERARTGSRTIIGPWGHVGMGKRRIGKLDFGPEAAVDLLAEQIRWFDYWLKGKDNGVDRTASYRIFVMGDNRWRDEPKWPLGRAVEQIYYLTSEGGAQTPSGNGRLVGEAPQASGRDSYVYDPEDPVPSLHGPALFQIPTDQRPLQDRRDILVYQTEPLAERIEVTGHPQVELYASSSAADTDFFVRLIDVAPDGLARDVSLGMVRARYRNGLDRPQEIERDSVVRYSIRMNATSNAFLPGHRIRLDVTSSDFPNYDRNHNTAANQNDDAVLLKATQTIHHGPGSMTLIKLPVIPPAGEASLKRPR